MSASADAARRFFTASHYAVAGASQDPAKFGYKLLAWYHAHSLPVTPINPKTSSISVPPPSPAGTSPPTKSTAYPTAASPAALPHPEQFSLSIVTPPAATRSVLAQAKEAGIKAVWLQPGTFDDDIVATAKAQFETVLAGEAPQVGGEGWCVLLHGDAALRAAREGAGKGKI